MFRIVTFIVLILFSLVDLKAQSLQAGPQGGANFSYYTGENVSPQAMKPGFHLGGYVKYPLSETLFLRSEFLISNKGTLLDSDTLDYRETLYYLDIPLLLEWQPDERFFKVYIGAQLSRLINAYSILEGNRREEPEIFKRYLAGIHGGLGYAFSSGLEIGVRFGKDLQGVYDEEELSGLSGVNFGRIDVRNMNLMFTVNYPLIK